MGREALCVCHVGTETASVKAVLESSALILRGTIKRSYALANLRDIRVAGGQLHFTAGAEAVALELGEAESRRWALKVSTPPPTLASKLGVGPEALAMVTGRLDDAALVAALQGAQARRAADATVLVAVVHSQADLAAAIATHGKMACRAVWIVHPKGRGADPSDTVVRQTLRAHGYMDNKTTAVSDTLTATRYARR
jgi:hypothetical protein